MKTALFLMFAGLLAATSCNKKSQDDGQNRTAPEVVSAAAPTPQASVAEGASDDLDIDLPEDFADEAAEQVTADNLEAQVSAVEKEVAAAD